MKNLFLVTFIAILSSFNAKAQNGTLAYDRGLFHTKAYQHTFKQSNKQLMALYRDNNVFEAERLLNRSKVLVPVGAVTSLAGIALGVDALVGTKHTAYIDNQEHVYYKRPILKLVSGLGLLAAGICIIEFGNDAKIKSINVFNKKQTSFTGKVGFTDSGNIGLQMKIN